MASNGLFRLLFSLSFFFFMSSSSSASAAPKVQLALYYETLCPYCSNFIVNYLPKIFNNGLISIVDLDLVPYGNARIGPNNTITCQHGSYECLLNTVEACAISALPDVHEHFSIVYCIELLAIERKYGEWESCFQKVGLSSGPIVECYGNGFGKKLELQYAAQTSALVPPHRYVPWVVVDGRPLYDDYRYFETDICKAYKGDLPKACEELLLTSTSEFDANKAAQACYANNMVSSIPVSSSAT